MNLLAGLEDLKEDTFEASSRFGGLAFGEVIGAFGGRLSGSSQFDRVEGCEKEAVDAIAKFGWKAKEVERLARSFQAWCDWCDCSRRSGVWGPSIVWDIDRTRRYKCDTWLRGDARPIL